ncbi:TonB-dependent receptor plug domain-containing protein [Brevundimonas sp. 2R-24]|uniref:TonB-dependent receptor plug domain-containing protein n=1 Tax=Peiella sedimenti TaxID=3061083 RepID=A0ABT8SN68_9CAUL|nr:TonB-dependent receptor plug domain-containing protein [Caulobacteraceae bacterium XZ-24]
MTALDLQRAARRRLIAPHTSGEIAVRPIRPAAVAAAALAAAGVAPAVAAQQAPSPIEVFPPEAFAAFNPSTALDMVNRVPGFDFQGGEAVRGLGGSAGNVLIDGRRPASKAETLGDVLGRVPAADVERIELIRGGAGGVDMQGYAVIANVVRRGIASVHGQSSIAIVLFPEDTTTWNLNHDVTRRERDQTLEISVALNNTLSSQGNADGRRIRIGSSPYDAEMTGAAMRYNANLRAAYATPWLGGDLRLRGSAAYTVPNTSEIIAYGPGAADVLETEAPRLTTEAGADFSRAFGPREASLTLLARREAGETRSTSRTASGEADFTTDSEYIETAARLKLIEQRGPAWGFDYGAEAAVNRLDSQTLYSLNGAAQTVPNANVVVQEIRGEVFAGLRWTGSAVGVEAALHAEASRLEEDGDVDLTKTFFYLKPRGVLTWRPSPLDVLTLSLERRVGQLDFNDFAASASFTTGTVDAGNADLQPDRRWQAELVWRRRFWDQGALVLTARHEAIEDVLDRVPVGAFDAVGNIGDGSRSTGRIDLTLPLDRLGLAGSQFRAEATWRDSSVRDPITGQQRMISGDIPREVSLFFSQELAFLNARWGLDLTAASESTAYRVFERRRTETGASVGLTYEQRFAGDYVLYAYIANLLDDSFVRDRTIYQGRREISPVAYRELRDAALPPWAYIRLRKRF